ncbi:hypothetical protein SAMN05421809_3509 [Natronorubrum daqingense]|uniref:Uncharacterized protein n=1 Tax=Natronorubrum daqingense TaxID=588898 RepID=A0A1N7FU68_9EURY|nr:hypothetical protein BB347_12850 [Natronorubrum daqingense]SIS03807.1 hypothetical protein SAMN05421809_3509 [Natronorubrum daqingense]
MSPRDNPSEPTPAPDTSSTHRPVSRQFTRRRVLTVGTTAAVASVAGCSSAVDFLADMTLEEVNVFNGADEPITGTIEIVDPDGEVALEESFDLERDRDGDDEDNEAAAFYDDTWSDAGEYEVSVELEDEPDEASDDGESADDGEDSDDGDDNDTPLGPERTDTVTVDDPDEERLVVGIAQEGPGELISFHVIEDFSELEEEFEGEFEE